MNLQGFRTWAFPNHPAATSMAAPSGDGQAGEVETPQPVHGPSALLAASNGRCWPGWKPVLGLLAILTQVRDTSASGRALHPADAAFGDLVAGLVDLGALGITYTSSKSGCDQLADMDAIAESASILNGTPDARSVTLRLAVPGDPAEAEAGRAVMEDPKNSHEVAMTLAGDLCSKTDAHQTSIGDRFGRRFSWSAKFPMKFYARHGNAGGNFTGHLRSGAPFAIHEMDAAPLFGRVISGGDGTPIVVKLPWTENTSSKRLEPTFGNVSRIKASEFNQFERGQRLGKFACVLDMKPYGPEHAPILGKVRNFLLSRGQILVNTGSRLTVIAPYPDWIEMLISLEPEHGRHLQVEWPTPAAMKAWRPVYGPDAPAQLPPVFDILIPVGNAMVAIGFIGSIAGLTMMVRTKAASTPALEPQAQAAGDPDAQNAPESDTKDDPRVMDSRVKAKNMKTHKARQAAEQAERLAKGMEQTEKEVARLEAERARASISDTANKPLTGKAKKEAYEKQKQQAQENLQVQQQLKGVRQILRRPDEEWQRLADELKDPALPEMAPKEDVLDPELQAKLAYRHEMYMNQKYQKFESLIAALVKEDVAVWKETTGHYGARFTDGRKVELPPGTFRSNEPLITNLANKLRYDKHVQMMLAAQAQRQPQHRLEDPPPQQHASDAGRR